MQTKTSKEIDERVGSNVRALRKKLGLSLIELSEKLEMSYQQLQKYEIGANRISTGTLVQLAHTMNVAPGYLIEMPTDHGSDEFERRRIKKQCLADIEALHDGRALLAASTLLASLVATQNSQQAELS